MTPLEVLIWVNITLWSIAFVGWIYNAGLGNGMPTHIYRGDTKGRKDVA